MKLLRSVRIILALAVGLAALALAVFYLFFATVSYESTTAAGVPGEPSVLTNTSGQIPWLSQAGPLAVGFMLAFSLLLVAAAVGLWRGALAMSLTLSLLALVFTFITGFSIGGLYFPVAALSLLGALLLAVEKLARRPGRSVV